MAKEARLLVSLGQCVREVGVGVGVERGAVRCFSGYDQTPESSSTQGACTNLT